MSDTDVEVEGVPVAPLDVRCHDANKDYVVVTWKQPAVEGSSPILGYFIDRSVRVQIQMHEVSQTRFVKCVSPNTRLHREYCGRMWRMDNFRKVLSEQLISDQIKNGYNV